MGGRIRRCSGPRAWLWVGVAVAFACGTDGNDPDDGLDGGAGLVADGAASASGGAPGSGGAPASGGFPGSAGANDIMACDTVQADATAFVEANKTCSTAGDCLEAFLLCFAQEEACCAVYLSEAEYRAAKQEAKRLGISLAELLRRSLRTMLPVDESRPWMRYAGMIESGDPNASQTIDEIVYGEKG